MTASFNVTVDTTLTLYPTSNQQLHQCSRLPMAFLEVCLSQQQFTQLWLHIIPRSCKLSTLICHMEGSSYKSFLDKVHLHLWVRTDTALHSAALLPNTNPCCVRFIEGNIHMCQGCKSFLRNAHGVGLTAPFNLCAARAERRSFRNVGGVLVTRRKEQPSCHYHLNLACIRAVAPQFVPSSLVIPSDVRPKLTQTHQEYLRLVFGLC